MDSRFQPAESCGEKFSCLRISTHEETYCSKGCSERVAPLLGTVRPANICRRIPRPQSSPRRRGHTRLRRSLRPGHRRSPRRRRSLRLRPRLDGHRSRRRNRPRLRNPRGRTRPRLRGHTRLRHLLQRENSSNDMVGAKLLHTVRQSKPSCS